MIVERLIVAQGGMESDEIVEQISIREWSDDPKNTDSEPSNPSQPCS